MPISDLFSRMLGDGLSLGQAMNAHSATCGEGMAFIDRHGHLSDLSYTTLAARAARQARALRCLGVAPGDPVLISCDDEQRLVTLLWTVWAAGAVAVPLGAPGSLAGDDPGARKLLAVARQCVEASGCAPTLLTDLDFLQAADHPLASHCRVLASDALEAPLQDGGASPLASWHADAHANADDVALLMFSSGSTGDPKGVRLTHRQLLSNLQQIARRSELRVTDRSLSWLPLTHDMGLVLFHLCHTLAGLRQYKTTPLSFARDPGAFFDRVGELGITVSGMPNFAFDQLLRAAARSGKDAAQWDLRTLRLIYNGAEPIDPALCRRFDQCMQEFGLPAGAISPGWGIAEACVVASQFPQARLAALGSLPACWVDPLSAMVPGSKVQVCAPHTPGSREVPSLGPLMDDMELRCLDDAGQPLADGYLGHLELRGPNVTRGYFGQPDRPWCPTGDIGFVLGGDVHLSGRAKDVLFINGRNHFSNDLEAFLNDSFDWPAGQLAVVGFTAPQDVHERVVIFFRQAGKAQSAHTAREMCQRLEQHLTYPVAAAIALPALPKTSSGKIRRFMLRHALLTGEYDASFRRESIASDAGLSEDEQTVVNELRVLVPELASVVSPQQRLIELGLDSVGHAQLAFRLSLLRQTGLGPLTPQSLLQAGTISAVAALLRATSPQPRSSTPVVTLRASRVPLDGRQLMLWTAWLLAPLETRYHENYVLTLDGALDTSRWLHAADAVIRATPMLNGIVDDRAELMLAVQPTHAPDTAFDTLSPDAAQEDIQRMCSLPFDLRQGPLIRLRLYQTGGQRFSLLVSAHHLVVDGWSLHHLLSRIFALHDNRETVDLPAGLPMPAATPHADAVLARRRQLAAAQAVRLPSEVRRDAQSGSGSHFHTLPAKLTDKLCAWVRQQGSSDFAVLAAAWGVLLGRLAQTECPLIATVASGRVDAAAAEEMGYFARTLPLAMNTSGKRSFAELVSDLDALRPDMVGNSLPDLSALADDAERPIASEVHAVFVHQNLPALQLPTGVRSGSLQCVRGPARVDLYVCSRWEEDRLTLEWVHDTARLGAPQIAAYAELFVHVLQRLLERPAAPLAELDLRSPGQIALQRPYQMAPTALAREQMFVPRFEQCCAQHGDRLALSDDTLRLSYRSLRAKVDALCKRLAAQEVRAGHAVCLLCARSADHVIALLATFKLGAIAVPIDPAQPAERMQAIVADSGAALLLASDTLALPEPLQAGRRVLRFGAGSLAEGSPYPCIEQDPDGIAYLIFTSGSTGRPKGVPIRHRSVANLVDWVIGAFAYRSGETICQFAPFSFDVSMAEVLPSLCAGLHVHILSDARRASPQLYLDTMQREAVAVATLTPAYLAVINETPQACADALGSLRLLIMGGEALKSDEVRRFRAHSPHVVIVNVYGPTETTVLSTAGTVPDPLTDDSAWRPLGLPIANTELWVLDGLGRPCPATVTGTIHIGGDGLCPGYWNDAARTAERFAKRNPDGGLPRRLYDTGDLARLGSDGHLHFVGRADNQVKLRGFRIELGEIEQVLERCEGIEAAVVCVRTRAGGEGALVAYYVGSRLPRQTLAHFVAERLPGYMRPVHYQWLDGWPLSTNRKVDRQQLPEPEWQDEADMAGHLPPEGATEQALASLWSGLLGLREVGRDAHFFLLGGSSLTAAQLANRIRERFGCHIALAAIVQRPVLADLAAWIDKAAPADDSAPVRGESRLEGPASEAQARMVFLHRQHPGSAMNNMPLSLALAGPLDAGRLVLAAGQLVARHPELRSRFISTPDGLRVRYDADTAAPRLVQVDDRHAALRAVEVFQCEGFDLETGPLWRIALVTRRDAEAPCWLALCVHHAIADGVTLTQWLGELDALYRGEELPASERLAYIDYAAWERVRLGGAFGEQAGAFWRHDAERAPLPSLPSQLDPTGGDTQGRQFVVSLDRRASEALQSLCDGHGWSPFALGLSLFAAGIGQRCNSQRLAVGVTLGGRTRAEFESVPGLFVNTLPLSLDWSPEEPLSANVARTRDRLARLLDVQDFPLNRVMAARGERELPFNVLFNEEVVPSRLQFGGHGAELIAVGTGTAKFPLVVSFLFGAGHWRWRIEHASPGLPDAWVDALAKDFERAAHALAELGDARLGDLLSLDSDLLALLTPR